MSVLAVKKMVLTKMERARLSEVGAVADVFGASAVVASAPDNVANPVAVSI